MRLALLSIVLLALPLNAQPADAPMVTIELVDGQLRQGPLVLTPRDFYERSGHPDLAERSERNLTRRRWFIGSGLAVAVVASVVGAVILGLTPNGEAPWCLSSVQRYNTCVDYIALYNHGGLGIIGGGVAIGAALAAIGLWHRPEVLSTFSLEELVDDYNSRLERP